MSASRLVDAVLFAEFDIDKGSVLRMQYPESVSTEEGLIAELMLPEGSHNHSADWTVFVLNRPAAATGQQQQQPGGASAHRRWPVQVYQYDTSLDTPAWVLATAPAPDGPSGTHWASLEDSDSDGDACLMIDMGGGERQRVGLHDDLQYSTLQPDFASLYDVDGDAIGLHFKTSEQQADFRKALDEASARASAAEGGAAQPRMLWCLSHVSSRRDKAVRRGALVKALAVASRHRFVHVWKPLLLLAMDRIYSLCVAGEHTQVLAAHAANSTAPSLNPIVARVQDPREQCAYLYDALNSIDATALPNASDLARQVRAQPALRHHPRPPCALLRCAFSARAPGAPSDARTRRVRE